MITAQNVEEAVGRHTGVIIDGIRQRSGHNPGSEGTVGVNLCVEYVETICQSIVVAVASGLVKESGPVSE